jgi:hypothetical protein
MPERQDYILRLLEELGRFLAEVVKFRQAGHYEAALLTLLQAQERLFVRPVPEFMTRPVEEQVHLLVLGETAAIAREKCLAYANLLTEAGHTYQARGQPALAQDAYQLALHVTLLAALRFSSADSAEPRARIAALRERLPAGELNEELKKLLDQLAANA